MHTHNELSTDLAGDAFDDAFEDPFGFGAAGLDEAFASPAPASSPTASGATADGLEQSAFQRARPLGWEGPPASQPPPAEPAEAQPAPPPPPEPEPELAGRAGPRAPVRAVPRTGLVLALRRVGYHSPEELEIPVQGRAGQPGRAHGPEPVCRLKPDRRRPSTSSQRRDPRKRDERHSDAPERSPHE